MISERLQKVVNMARFGTGNEAEVAKRIVRRECEKEGLNFDDVMKGTQKNNYSYNSKRDDWSYYSYWSYTDNYQRRNYKQEPKTESQRQKEAKETWEDLKRQSDEVNKRREQQQKEREERRYQRGKYITDFADKHGTVWNISEIYNLTKKRRLDLFDGDDPIAI